ncbi:hypothetical protein BROC_01324 [Candidatus Brocadiaceae bacterium]|nr:hypothetical protein BROC_01324 [Candidatus Brocadiaceae bacterium]
MHKNSLKNKRYLDKYGLTRHQFIVPKEVKKTFDIATTYLGTDMSEPLVALMLKYNSKFINLYGNKIITN